MVFVTPPTFDNILYQLLKLGHCEPGTDGAPPSAWKFGGEAAARYMEGILNNVLSGIALLVPQPKKVSLLGVLEVMGVKRSKEREMLLGDQRI